MENEAEVKQCDKPDPGRAELYRMAAMPHPPPECPGGGAPETLFCRTVFAAAPDSGLGLSLFPEPRKLAKGSNTASSKAATHSACRCEAGPRRNARERSTVTAAMTHVIHRAFVTYVTTISFTGFIGLSPPSRARAPLPKRSTSQVLWDRVARS